MLSGTAARTPDHRLATFSSGIAATSVSLLEIEVAAGQWGLCRGLRCPSSWSPPGTSWLMPLDLLNLALQSDSHAYLLFVQHGTCEKAQPAGSNTLFVELRRGSWRWKESADCTGAPGCLAYVVHLQVRICRRGVLEWLSVQERNLYTHRGRVEGEDSNVRCHKRHTQRSKYSTSTQASETNPGASFMSKYPTFGNFLNAPWPGADAEPLCDDP